ncbi:long-chain fatty acid--CoA ligase [Kroppenstedtia eburnea]|uniref:Long-chain acyl-CoA synthetase n=1 Tax=Kroppenstedtia eburnea TaxID=714067 RepID=A0A1N7LZC6_9BACL|nr:long-chain fatty acid--CoA ligase [Kroppenstedtia eburnea]QKI81736.1 long-chain fatty acid--CoA ligase [Kroppenstedtia eburnea]SIS79200.1 long-chain acyl-CoA synthetase [Kroppenstedtia eburnea]
MTVKERLWFKYYPEEVPKSLEYPDQPLPDLLKKSAKDYPEREAIYFMGKRITYRELMDDVHRMARALKELGVKKGERVSIMLANSPQAVIAYYAVLTIGGVVVQTNPMYKERELEHMLTDSGAETIICLDLVYQQVEKVKPRTPLKRVIVTGIKDYLPFPKNWLYSLKLKMDGTQPQIPYGDGVFAFSEIMKKAMPEPVEIEIASMDEVALLQYTGGTTGLAKGAMLTHRNIVVNVVQCHHWMYKGERGKEKVLGLVPFFHVYGMTVVMNFSVYMAATMVLVPRFDVKDVLKVIDKERPSLFPGAPTMYVGLINHPEIAKYDLSSIKACISGSAPLPVAVQERFEKLTGGRLVEGYGLTECSPVTHANPIWEKRKNGSIGLPWPDTECRVVDPDTGEEMEAGVAGLLQVKGPQVMKGYWNRKEETEKVLRDGWLNTGDIAMMDEDGYFYIMDRQKDMIIAGGFNIYPREVEEVLYDHPAVQEVAVIGVPDPYRGETVKAFLVLKPDAKVTEQELNTYCRSKLANYKVPRLYEFRDQLPKTTVGKVLRRELAEEERRKAAAEEQGKTER